MDDKSQSPVLKYRNSSFNSTNENAPMSENVGRLTVSQTTSHISMKSEKDDEKHFHASGDFVILPENEIEAHRMQNNLLFGFKKWKSHVTERPLSERSEIVKGLYTDTDQIPSVRVSTCRPTNIIYVMLIGWWLAGVYAIISAVLFVTVIGRDYSHMCIKLARYFIWPFGKYVHQIHPIPLDDVANLSNDQDSLRNPIMENTPLVSGKEPKYTSCGCSRDFWKRPDTYVWLVVGVPILTLLHFVIFFFSWLFVITIPIAKLNIKAITKLMYLPPEQIDVGDSGVMDVDVRLVHSEILMYTHQSVNVYYYKYTIDGMNVILVNLLVFVVLSLVLGYADPENKVVSGIAKFFLACFAIVPLTYYIGQAIASISAQSVLAVGAVLNATFGSLVEIIIYVIMLVKGMENKETCYVEFVKSGMAGTLLATILFIPGISMMIGGIKYSHQNFNRLSAGVSASLLFIAVIGAFSPSVFAHLFGTLYCEKCEPFHAAVLINGTNVTNVNDTGLECSNCIRSIFGIDQDMTLYNKHILPLIYAVAIILPISYILGLIFTFKTHTGHLYDKFNEENPAFGSHGSAHWGLIKCIIIMLSCAVLISLCAEVITNNLEPILQKIGLSEYFVGITLIAVIPELPEVVNGIQFALQDNVSLGIEVGSTTAVQVSLIQIPLMILINLIYPALNFTLIFDQIHLWVVIFAVLLFNYIVMDGKSDYFQGSIMVAVYLLIVVMYFFCPVPKIAKCVNK